MASVYKQFYGRDLVEVLDKETSGHFGRALHYLILPPIVLDAELLHDACIGAGTNERVSTRCVDSGKALRGKREHIAAVFSIQVCRQDHEQQAFGRNSHWNVIAA